MNEHSCLAIIYTSVQVVHLIQKLETLSPPHHFKLIMLILWSTSPKYKINVWKNSNIFTSHHFHNVYKKTQIYISIKIIFKIKL